MYIKKGMITCIMGKNGMGKTTLLETIIGHHNPYLGHINYNGENIENKELENMLSRGVKIVDVRRPDEWKKTGTVKESKRLTAFDGKGRFVSGFLAAFGKIVKPDDEIILICRTGNRSAILAHMLTERTGYKHVYNVKAGISKWVKDKYPVRRH